MFLGWYGGWVRQRCGRQSSRQIDCLIQFPMGLNFGCHRLVPSELIDFMRRRAAEHYKRAEQQVTPDRAEESRKMAQLCEAAAASLARRAAIG
jgi:hypothetical protein